MKLVGRDKLLGNIKEVSEVACAIFQWLKDNKMKTNADKYHALLNTSNALTVEISEVQIKSSQWEKLQVITIDDDLKFRDHINNISGKASTKISAWAIIAPYMDLPKRKQITNAIFKSQFSYSPLAWMMHSRLINDKIYRLHKRCLRVAYNDSQSSFDELLERDNSVSVHNRNTQCLAISLYKVFNGVCPDIRKDVFIAPITERLETYPEQY